MTTKFMRVNYWLFQSNPKVFDLKGALAADALQTFLVKAHKKKIQAGDKVILWQSGKQTGCYGLALIETNPSEMAVMEQEVPFFTKLPNSGLRVSLKIEYNLWNKPITKEILPSESDFEPFYAGKAGVNFKATEVQYRALVSVIERLEAVEEPPIPYLPIKRPLTYLNLILEGPPGTGKTYQTVNYALSIIENRPLTELAIESRKALRQRFDDYQKAGNIQFITFHQSYSYEDFVEGIKPKTEDGHITYGIEDGIFKRICLTARQHLQEFIEEQNSDGTTTPTTPPVTQDLLDKAKKYVLIIDEINRGNTAGIFGELITLLELDKRWGMPEAMQCLLPYSKTSLAVPPNLHIIGTMNTSGRNTTNLDIALRRRFEFIAIPPQPKLLQQSVEAGVDLVQLLTAINARIKTLLGENYQIGHAYFMSVRTLEDLSTLFANNILPLLASYFFNDWQKVAAVIGSQFFEAVQSPDYTLLSLDDDLDISLNIKKNFELKPKIDWREEDFIKIYNPKY